MLFRLHLIPHLPRAEATGQLRNQQDFIGTTFSFIA
jgi:hypothetical protein